LRGELLPGRSRRDGGPIQLGDHLLEAPRSRRRIVAQRGGGEEQKSQPSRRDELAIALVVLARRLAAHDHDAVSGIVGIYLQPLPRAGIGRAQPGEQVMSSPYFIEEAIA
jgi:hypothetical protein